MVDGGKRTLLHEIFGQPAPVSFQRGQLVPKFRVEGVALTNNSSYHKTRINHLSFGVRM